MLASDKVEMALEEKELSLGVKDSADLEDLAKAATKMLAVKEIKIAIVETTMLVKVTPERS